MNDGFEAIFNVERLPRHVWESACLRDDGAERGPLAVGAPCRVPGFPSFDRNGIGCLARVVESRAEQLLRCRKQDEPCKGTEITIQIEPANAAGWPTRITLTQSGFGDWLAAVRDTFETHWRQIAADFRLYVERGISVPPTRWGVSLGAATRHTPVGLEITSAEADGFAHRAGIEPGDLLLTLADIRIHDTAQLWTVLALVPRNAATTVTWARDREVMTASAEF